MEPVPQGRHPLSLMWRNKALNTTEDEDRESPVKVLRDIRRKRMGFPRRGFNCWRVRRQYSSKVPYEAINYLHWGMARTRCRTNTRLGRITFQHELVLKAGQRCCSHSPFMSIKILNRERTNDNFRQEIFKIGHGESGPWEQIVERIEFGDRGRRRNKSFFHPAEVDSNLRGDATSDTMHRWQEIFALVWHGTVYGPRQGLVSSGWDHQLRCIGGGLILAETRFKAWKWQRWLLIRSFF